jgi:hypothetical protein
LTDTEIVIASDVQNPLIGPEGAAAVYGPQKGADPAQVAALDAGLTHLVERLVACAAIQPHDSLHTPQERARRAGSGSRGCFWVGTSCPEPTSSSTCCSSRHTSTAAIW